MNIKQEWIKSFVIPFFQFLLYTHILQNMLRKNNMKTSASALESEHKTKID